MFSGVFRVKEVDGVGDNRSGNTTMVNVRTLLEVFLNMYQRYACLTDKVFSSCKGHLLVLGLFSSSAGLSRFSYHQKSD